MLSLAGCVNWLHIEEFNAFLRVVWSGTFYTNCIFVAVCGGMYMGLATVALYGGVSGLVLFAGWFTFAVIVPGR